MSFERRFLPLKRMTDADNTISGQWTFNANVQFGATASQFSAAIAARGKVDAFEWGHSNTAGYGNTLGMASSSGAAHVILHGAAGTSINTFRTFGNVGVVLRKQAAGYLEILALTTATGDNQTGTLLSKFTPSGTFIYDSTGADYLQLHHDGTNAWANAVNVNVLGLQTESTTRFQVTAGTVQVVSGNVFYVFDSADTASFRISTTSAVARLSVVGTSAAYAYLDNGTTEYHRFYVDGSGYINFGGGGVYCYDSGGTKNVRMHHNGSWGNVTSSSGQLVLNPGASASVQATGNTFLPTTTAGGTKGYVDFNVGDTTHPGYMEIFNEAGTRVSYLGWDDGTTRTQWVSENSWGLRVTSAADIIIDAATSTTLSYSGTSRIVLDSTGLGFFAATPVAKPTVTGSRGGNAALASLLTGLANLGLITDSST